jgi:hypothetical protein
MAESLLQACPQCRRMLYFSHSETTLMHCTCGATVQRKDGEMEARPFYTILQPTGSIQPGAEGSWNEKKFRVTGRIRAWFEASIFNYWTIIWDDGAIGYLGEGYGLYAVYEKVAIDRVLSSSLLDDIKIGAKRDLFKNVPYILERKYTCYKWELESEAWLPHVPSTFRTFEFVDLDSRRIEVIEVIKNVAVCFTVHHTTYTALGLTGTRTTGPSAKTLTCNNCEKENTLKAFPYTHSYSCIHCGTRYFLDTTQNFKSVNDRNKTDAGTDITLGALGILRGVRYEVIGYAQKEEQNEYRSQWKEYTLYNATEGFAFLSEYNGHWMYVRERGDAPVLPTDAATTLYSNDEGFELFNKYRYEVVNAAGEFPYDAFKNHNNYTKEFIAPPEVWIQEKSSREGIMWFFGVHINAKEIDTAFGESIIHLPGKVGVGAIEPKGFVNPLLLGKTALGAVLVLVLIHILTSFTHLHRIISENTFSFNDSTDAIAFVKDKFTLEKWRSNLQFDIAADVDNSWMEVGVTLVNAGDGTEYTFEKGVEYYHGYSEGESWTEGDRNETAYLSKIPAGTYFLQIRASREARHSYGSYSLPGVAATSTTPTRSFNMTVTYDTTNNWNLFLCIIPILLWPLIHFFTIRHNENRRWSNSPYSPYTTSNE